MAVNPVLVIKVTDDAAVGVKARLKDDYSEHNIVLNSILAYYWSNNMPAPVKFLELFESVIKRTINEILPHKDLNLKYEVTADDDLEKATSLEINLITIDADGVGFKIDGKDFKLNHLNKDGSGEKTEFNEVYEKTIETPKMLLDKYIEMKN